MAKKNVVDSKACSMSIDMTNRAEVLGLEVLMTPFLQHLTTQRGAMFCSNVAQAMLVDGAEMPMIYTGWEKIMGQYEWDEQGREADAVVFENIPKFIVGKGLDPIHTIPENIVIYTYGNTASYMSLKKYKEGKFGYKYKLQNTHMLTEGNYIPKDIKFSTSPTHDGNKYMMGVNANVAYMSLPQVAEDAFVISRTLANKLKHYATETISCDIGIDDIPLNLYGDGETSYKAFPDVGDVVRDDAILMAIRKPKGMGYIADISADSLKDIQYLHDEILGAAPGAEVLDINVYIKSSALSKMSDNMFAQFIKYHEQHHRFNQKIIDCYERLKKENYILTPKLNALITRAILFEREREDKKLKLVNKKEPIEFIHIELVIGYRREVDKAFKISDRNGGKGVISDHVWEDEDMPTDKHGIRADLIVSPDSPFNRMNTAQNDEQFFNRASELMRQRLVRGELGNAKEAFEKIMEYIGDIRPNYVNLIRSKIKNIKDMERFLDGVRAEGIYLCIPPFLNIEMKALIPFIEKKYKVHDEHVTYYVKQADGTKKKYTTEQTVCVGSKYIYLLGKIPLDMLTAVEFGYVSQFNTPTRPKSKKVKQRSPVKATPIRLGEDETSVLTMAIGSEEVYRMMSLYSNAPDSVKKLQKELLTNPYPTRINEMPISTQELVDSNVNNSLMRHMLGVIGLEFDNESNK